MKRFLIFIFTIILSFGFLCIPFNNNVVFASSNNIINVNDNDYNLSFSNDIISNENYYSPYSLDNIKIWVDNIELPYSSNYSYGLSVFHIQSPIEITSFNDEYYDFDVAFYNSMEDYYVFNIRYFLKHIFDTSSNRHFYYFMINSYNFEMLNYCPINKFSVHIPLYPSYFSEKFNSWYNDNNNSNFNFSYCGVRTNSLTIDFHFNYNNEYYYNNFWGLVFDNRLASEDILGAQPEAIKNLKLYSNDINNNIFCFSHDEQSSLNNYKINFLNNYNYNSVYINRVSYNFKFPPSNHFTIATNSEKLYMLGDYGVYLNIQFFDSEDCLISSYNRTNNSQIFGSSLLPIGTNDLYRNCEWYDIPSHLYNFLIFLVFDCPLISDILSLFYILIAFIVNSFNVIIQFFASVNNTLFITLFIGLIVLSFLFKIIFGGEK